MNYKQRKLIRKVAKLPGTNYSIQVVEGTKKPRLVGKSYHWTTMGGKPIYYPNAYKWQKIYVSSSLRIEVGKIWLARRGIFEEQERINQIMEEMNLNNDIPFEILVDAVREKDYELAELMSKKRILTNV